MDHLIHLSTPGGDVVTTTAANSRPLRADAVRNRKLVTAAAAKLLARDGESTSMRAIAREAGVGLATVYRQFPDKAALYAAMIADQITALTELARSKADDGDPGAAFFDYFAESVASSDGQKLLVDGLIAAGVDYDAALGSLNQDLHQATEVLLRRAQQAGAVRLDLGMPELRGLLTATCLGAERQHWDDRLRTRILGIVFDGFRPAT